MSDREWSIRATNRAIYAASIAETVRDDVQSLKDRIKALEASNRDLQEIVEALLEMIEGRT